MQSLNVTTHEEVTEVKQKTTQRIGSGPYRPRTVVAHRLNPGEQLYVSNPAVPANRLLTMDEHFRWEGPRAGRPHNPTVRYSQDTSNAAILTAIVPLLIALHEPWSNPDGGATFHGCFNVGHMRLARETHHTPDVVEYLDASVFCPNDFALRKACKESNMLEHLVPGGPLCAVAYPDELVIPNYEYIPGERDAFMFTHIVNQAQLPALRQVFVKGARFHNAVAAGVAPRAVDARPKGAINTVSIRGGMELTYDSAGLIFGLRRDGVDVGSLAFGNGIWLNVGGRIEDPRIRQSLGLDAAPEQTLEVLANPAPAAPIRPPAIAATVAPVERRAKPPTLESLAKPAETPVAIAPAVEPPAPVEVPVKFHPQEEDTSVPVHVEPKIEERLRSHVLTGMKPTGPDPRAKSAVCEVKIPLGPGVVVRSLEEWEKMVGIPSEEDWLDGRSEAQKKHDAHLADMKVISAREMEIGLALTEAAKGKPGSCDQGFPIWFAEAVKELTPIVLNKPCPGELSAEDGTVIATAGQIMDENVVAAVVMYHDQLAFEGEETEMFYSIKETLAAVVELHDGVPA